MARNFGRIFVLTLTLSLGCGGGGSKGLSISAEGSTQLTLDQFTGLYHGVTLDAKFSDGTTPTNVSWSSSVGCIGVRGGPIIEPMLPATSGVVPGPTTAALRLLRKD